MSSGEVRGDLTIEISRPWRGAPGARTRRAVLNRRMAWGLLALVAVGWSLGQAGVFDGELINRGGWTILRRFLLASVHPEHTAEFLRLVMDAALTTLAFAVWGTLLSLVLGSIGGVLGSEVCWRTVFPARSDVARRLGGYRAPWLTVRAILAVPRSIHELIWGLFFLNIFGLDPLVGILAIGIAFGAITAKVFSELLDEAPRQALIALHNSGVPPLKTFLYALLPQAFLDLVSYAFYRFECSIRSAAVLGIVGAGGLGYEIFLSLQSLRYEEIWTLLYALILLTGLTDVWSTGLRRRLATRQHVKMSVRTGSDGAVPTPAGDPIIRGTLLGCAVLLVFSFWYIDADFGKLLARRTAEQLAYVVGQSVPPSLGALGLPEMLHLSANTLAMSILAVAGAGLGGMLLSFFAAHNLVLPGGVLNVSRRRSWPSVWGSAVFVLTRAVLLFFRGVPAPVWALIFLFVMFPGILPGALGLGVYTLGVLGRLMAEVIENMDVRPLHALRVQGASGLQVFLYGVLPSMLPRFTAFVLYRWEVAIRATVMVGLVGAGGLGRLLAEQLSSFDYSGVAATVLAFLALTFMVDLISAVARRDLR